MSIVVDCACGRRLKARDEAAGKTAKCPSCGSPVTVPKRRVSDAVIDLTHGNPLANHKVPNKPQPSAAVDQLDLDVEDNPFANPEWDQPPQPDGTAKAGKRLSPTFYLAIGGWVLSGVLLMVIAAQQIPAQPPPREVPLITAETQKQDLERERRRDYEQQKSQLDRDLVDLQRRMASPHTSRELDQITKELLQLKEKAKAVQEKYPDLAI